MVIIKENNIFSWVLKLALSKVVKIIVIAAIIMVIIAGSVEVIKIKDGSHKEGDNSNTGNVVNQKVLENATIQNITVSNNDADSGAGYSIDINLDTTVDEVIKELEENNGCLNDYLSEKNLKKYLTAFIKAELVTQFPDLRSDPNKIGTPTEEGEFQGCIQIHRAAPDTTDGKTQILTYIDPTTFENYKTNADPQILNHFTLKDEGDLVVAGWTRTTTNITSNVPDIENLNNRVEYTIVEKSIAYKSVLEPYILPFDLLWALTVSGEDEDFSYNLAQLAINSKIIFTVQDNLTTRTETSIEKYEEQVKIDKQAACRVLYDGDEYSHTAEITNFKDPVPYETKTIIKTETCSVNLDITYADTWIAEYKNSYSNNIPDVVYSTEEEPQKIDDTEYTFVERGTLQDDDEINKDLLNFQIIVCGSEEKYLQEKQKHNISAQKGTIMYNKYSRTANHTISHSTEMSYNNYRQETPTVTEKTEEFQKLYNGSRKASANIESSPTWLFKMLESGPKTADMVDLVKYLLYKATGIDYGVIGIDLGIYNLSSFKSVSGVKLLREYIREWEHSYPPPTNADGTKYIIENDGAGNPAVGYGVDINANRQLFIDAGYPTDFGGEVDIEFVDALEEKIIDDNRKLIKAMTSELNLTDYQINALVSRSYNCGVAGAISYTRGALGLNFVDSYNMYWNEEIDDKFEEKDKNVVFTHSLYQQYMKSPVTSDGMYMEGLERRRKSEWVLFQTGYYDVLDKWHSSAGDLVEAADIIHQQEITWTYSVGGDLYWNDIEMSLNNPNRVTCCATFVSCAIYYAGYFTEEEMNNFSNYNLCSTLYEDLKDAGWQEIKSYDELEPGDVVFTNNINDSDYLDHVQIYAGDDTWYNAGSTESIQRASPYSQGNWARTYFYVALRPK